MYMIYIAYQSINIDIIFIYKPIDLEPPTLQGCWTRHNIFGVGEVQEARVGHNKGGWSKGASTCPRDMGTTQEATKGPWAASTMCWAESHPVSCTEAPCLMGWLSSVISAAPGLCLGLQGMGSNVCQKEETEQSAGFKRTSGWRLKGKAQAEFPKETTQKRRRSQQDNESETSFILGYSLQKIWANSEKEFELLNQILNELPKQCYQSPFHY